MQYREVSTNRNNVNNNISKLKGLGKTKRELWKEKLRNRSI